MTKPEKLTELVNYLAQYGMPMEHVRDFYNRADTSGSPEPENKNEILVYGPIVDEETRKMLAQWFGMNHFVSGNSFKKEMDAIQGELTVRINSPGGAVFEGATMNTLLTSRKGQVNVIIDGMCASAATFLLMPASKISAGELANVLIHNTWMGVMGDKKELRKMADWLEKSDEQIATFYARRMKQSKAKILEMMDEETTFTAEEAVKNGIADAIIGKDAEPEGKQKEKAASPEASVNTELVQKRARAMAVSAKILFGNKQEIGGDAAA